MKNAKCALFTAVILALSILAPGKSSLASAAAGKHLVIIMGASSPVTDVSSAVLRRAFLGEAADMGGGKRFIALNHPPSSAVRVSFDKLVLGLSAEQVGAFWIDRKIRAESSAPRAVPSPELAARIVASLPGAVTYATPELVTPQVKVLTVDGKAPGSAGYPLTY
jgi:hypothetical protein